MPFEVAFSKPPAGYLVSVDKTGEAKVAVREFISSEEGELFISRLEGFPLQLISMLPETSGISPGMIDHMLAIVRPDKSATVYVNELSLMSAVRSSGRRDIKIGGSIYVDDILDIEKLSFPGIDIPNDSGVLFVFSAGWRKGFFYDLSPLTGTKAKRQYDLEVTLGRYFAYLSFLHLFKITEDEWNILFSQQWFPFASLKWETRKRILRNVRNKLIVDDLSIPSPT